MSLLNFSSVNICGLLLHSCLWMCYSERWDVSIPSSSVGLISVQNTCSKKQNWTFFKVLSQINWRAKLAIEISPVTAINVFCQGHCVFGSDFFLFVIHVSISGTKIFGTCLSINTKLVQFTSQSDIWGSDSRLACFSGPILVNSKGKPSHFLFYFWDYPFQE